MLDVGGQDATEAFEDVGHSDEARETLEQLLVGTLKRQVSTKQTFTHWILSSPDCRHGGSFPTQLLHGGLCAIATVEEDTLVRFRTRIATLY